MAEKDGKVAFLLLSEFTKIENGNEKPLVTLHASRSLTLEFPTMEAKNEFYECFPLLVEGMEKV